MKDAFLVGGVRTPVGRYGGALAHMRPDDLAALVVGEVVERVGLPGEAVDDVVLGAANQAGEDNRNVARMAALLAGLPDSVPGYTVNRLCASGLQAVASAVQGVKSDGADVVVAGGAESMTRAPWVLAKPGAAWSKPSELVDTALGWRLVNPRMRALDGGDATLSLGACTEKLARQLDITRADADAYACRSQAVASTGWKEGWYDQEIVAVPSASGVVATDQTVRVGTTVEALANLRPAFAVEGVCTAGNSSPLSDGASALVIASGQALKEYGLRPRARVLSYAVAGLAPSMFGLGPVPAIQRALQMARLDLADIDQVDINEAFAAQVLACARELGLDPYVLNRGGGAIALGHPLGSSGSRMLITLMGHLERTEGRLGIAALCIGVGQGAAMVIERCE